MTLPVIDTLEKVDHVLNHLPAYRGKRREPVLKLCEKTLANLHFKGEVTPEEMAKYRTRIYRARVKARG